MKTVTALFLSLIFLFSLTVPAHATEEFLYTHETTGAEITVPTSWKLEYDDESINFVPRSGKATSMCYRYVDIWSELSTSEKENMSRLQYDNDQVAKADIADLLDVRSKEVKLINLAGNEYFQVTAVTKKGFFLFKSKSTLISMIRVENGYAHIFQFSDDTSNALYSQFEDMVASVMYDTKISDPIEPNETRPLETVNTDDDIYLDAKDAYENGDYRNAEMMFYSVLNYKDSQKYLRLIRIRNYGSNIGIGCVYDYRKALTDDQKAEIDEAANDFYFADTADVLLCNTDVACYYLGSHNGMSGNWITGSVAPSYAYFKLHKDSSGGYYYTRSTNLSKAVSDCVSIIDGDVRISITSSNTLVFTLRLTGPNSMLICSHETGMATDLYRQ